MKPGAMSRACRGECGSRGRIMVMISTGTVAIMERTKAFRFARTDSFSLRERSSMERIRSCELGESAETASERLAPVTELIIDVRTLNVEGGVSAEVLESAKRASARGSYVRVKCSKDASPTLGAPFLPSSAAGHHFTADTVLLSASSPPRSAISISSASDLLFSVHPDSVNILNVTLRSPCGKISPSSSSPATSITCTSNPVQSSSSSAIFSAFSRATSFRPVPTLSLNVAESSDTPIPASSPKRSTRKRSTVREQLEHVMPWMARRIS
mmetsp:Transcript_587/g.1379  ORF Transcript_587/g.1379 Transcript_587/m.1379 type:complete len:270 (+) Transcript_587:2126-2935(+)